MPIVEAELEGLYHYPADCFCVEERGLLHEVALRPQETTVFQNLEVLYFTHFLAFAGGHFCIFCLDGPQV